MRKRVDAPLAWIGLLLIALSCGCSSEGPSQARLHLTGSSTLAPMITEIANRFEQQHPGARIDVQSGGSTQGIRDAQQGLVDLGMSSRSLKPDEEENLQVVTVAYDGVAFVVHRDNPVSSLNRDQLRDIFSGNITRWSEVGGGSGPIVVANRAEGRSELTLVSDYLDLAPNEFRATIIDGETQQSIKSVVTNEQVIGYTSMGAAQFAAEQGSPIKLLPLEGVAASPASIQAESYPLARPLILLQSDTASELAEAFVKFVLSESNQDVTRNLGYVPIPPATRMD